MSTTTSLRPGRQGPGPKTQDLLASAASGDDDAWEVLYRRYRMMLLAHARSMLGREIRSRFDAEDLVQSAFLAAWGKIRSFEYRGEGSFRRWLAGIVVNRARDRVRAARNEGDGLHKHSHDQLGRTGEELHATEHQPARAAEKVEEEERVLDALTGLGEDEREVVLLKNFENKSWSEVAEVIGRNERSARRLYDEAVRHLARAIGSRRKD